MFHFGIPLKSRKIAKNWDRTCQLLDGTLRSIFNQTDQNFRVYVACHDVPETSFKGDPRLEILQVDFPPPLYRDEMIVDKHRKREVIGVRVRSNGAGYLMFVDADDLVSNRLVDYVHTRQAPHGYIALSGYELDYARQTVANIPRIDRLSGSCCVVKWAVEDLPTEPMSQTGNRFREFLNNRHPTWYDIAKSQGRPLEPFPFRAVMYVWNNGENWAATMGQVGPRRKLLRALLPSRPVKPSLANEFAIRPAHQAVAPVDPAGRSTLDVSSNAA